MPFRIAKSFAVESGHMLSKHPGACRFPHGHSRTIEIVVVSDRLNAADMVLDFKTLKTAAADLIDRFDHTFALNTADPHFADLRSAYSERIVPFENTDPTTEVLAREIFHTLRQRLSSVAPDARLERVRVTETATSWAEYWE